MSPKLLQDFNKSDTIIAITSYPDPDQGIKELNAVAWHSERILKEFSTSKRIFVLAEQINAETTYQPEENIVVHRVWKRGNPFSLIAILKTILSMHKVESVLFQFEFNVFGGIWPVLFLPIIVALLRLAGKKVFFEIHQVILDIKQLAQHINIQNRLFQEVFNAGLHYFYWTVSRFSTKLIVLEGDLKQRLSHFVEKEKIIVLPIAIERARAMPPAEAKEKIGVKKDDFVVLVFGFVNWYKGSDWIAKTCSQLKDKNIKLVLAGGPNPTLKDKTYYKTFYNEVETLAKKHKNIMLTGFVEDKDVRKYFSAADLVVLPYRVFMSASGPFSFALSYKKPVILANNLHDYSHSEDFADALKAAKLQEKDIFFPMNTRSFHKVLRKVRENKDYYDSLKLFSTTLGAQRTLERTVKKLERAIDFSYMYKNDVGFTYKGRLALDK